MAPASGASHGFVVVDTFTVRRAALIWQGPIRALESSRLFPGEAETVAARFRAFVEDDVSLPAAAAGDDQDAHAVAAAIIAFLSSPQRMTTDGTRAKHREVLKEMWHFADYLCQEVESHASLDPPLKFPEKRWAANARA